MLWTAIEDPDPVIIFEHGALFGLSEAVPRQLVPVDLDRAAVRRSGTDVTLVTHGGSLHTSLTAAEVLAEDGVSVEVIDLRSMRPLDMDTIAASVKKTGRLVVVDESHPRCSMAADIAGYKVKRMPVAFRNDLQHLDRFRNNFTADSISGQDCDFRVHVQISSRLSTNGLILRGPGWIDQAEKLNRGCSIVH